MAKSLQDWQDEIRRAKMYQDAEGRLDKWRKYRGWYRNRYPSQTVSVNKVFSQGRALVPQLYYKHPTIVIRPRKPMFAQTGKVLESVDQWLVEHMGFKQQIKMMIIDAYITNIGVGKVGYHSVATELPHPDKEQTEALAEFLGAPGEELQDELDRRKWSYHDYIKPDSPWYLRTNPKDVLVPWGFVDEHELPWIAFRVVRPLDDVMSDPVYGGKTKLQPNVKPDLEGGGVKSPNMFGERGTATKFVELFEIWDKRDGHIRVLSMDHSKWLREEEHDLQIVGSPCTVLRFNPDGEDFWGVSDVEQIHKQVFELNENRTHEIEHKRLANVKVAVDTNTIPEDEISKLEKGKPGPIIRGTGNVSQAMAKFETGVPGDLYRVDEIIDKDIRDVLGFSRNQAGEFDLPRRTATEANIVREAHQLRSDERRDLVGDLIEETFRDKVHPLIFQNWTEQRVIEVTSMGGWVKYTGPQIKGDYDVDVIADSTLPMTRQMEQQVVAQAFTMFKGDPRVKQRELYVMVLNSYKELVPDPEMLLVPEDQLMQAAQQNALVMMLQQGPQGAAGQPRPQGNGQPAAQGAR